MNPRALLTSSGVTILIYHRVLPARDPMRPSEPTVSEFERQMRVVRRWFRPVPLADAVSGLRAGTAPPRAVAVTFDDGYRDNLELAAPVLTRLRVPATVFVSTGFSEGHTMWNDQVIEAFRESERDVADLSSLGLGRHPLTDTEARRRAALSVLRQIKPEAPQERLARVGEILERLGCRPPRSPMMTPAEVRRLADLDIEIGGHTVNHPILSRLDDEAARREIVDGRTTLEAWTGRPVRFFAYPNGRPGEDYTARDVALVRAAGFEAAVSTRAALACNPDDDFELPRVGPWSNAPLKFGVHLARRFTDGATR